MLVRRGGSTETAVCEDFPVNLLGERVPVRLHLRDGTVFDGRCYRAFGGWLLLLADPRVIAAEDVLQLDVGTLAG